MKINLSLTRAVLIASILVILFSPSTAIGSTSVADAPLYTEDLHAFMDRRMEDYDIPGAAVAIVRNGQLEFTGGFGRADAAGTPVTPETPFLLASVSKSMTAVTVMQLVEAGMLDLSAPVQRYLPWFEVRSGEAEEITVARLLYHTSGLPLLDGRLSILEPDGPNSLEDGVRALSNVDLRFPPGTDWEYSNLNYNLLGLLVQEISGQPFHLYLQNNLFTPLGMHRTFTTLPAARQSGAASGFYPFFGVPLSFDRLMVYSGATLPSAGVWSTASDLGLYLQFHLGAGGAVITESGLDSLHTSGADWGEGNGYAMGWNRYASFIDPEFLATMGTDLDLEGDLATLVHEGGWLNYKSVALMVPAQGLGVILLMNSNDPAISSGLRSMAWDIAVIAAGGEAQYFPAWEEGFLVRNSRWLFGVVTLLLIGELGWTLKMYRESRKPGTIRLWLPVAVEIGLIGYVVLALLPGNEVTWWFLMRNGTPDVALLISLVFLTGVVRLIFAIRQKVRALH